VYHDDYGDYSTNEPTMDGTASLIYLLAAKDAERSNSYNGKNSGQSVTAASTLTYDHGAITRGDVGEKKIALVFTGDEYYGDMLSIERTLRINKVKASFFLTGRFYRNEMNKLPIRTLKSNGHYMGPHSDQHLLYCDWGRRDSLLVTKEQFIQDLDNNYAVMAEYGISKQDAPFFLPPFEWYNDSIAAWTKQQGLQLVNFTPGTYSNADYTTPDMKNYRSSVSILDSIIAYEKRNKAGLNGFILLFHVGAHPSRTDSFARQLPILISWLQKRKYTLTTIHDLIKL
jgi:peptidoglycan/xylan/chitin deacetylase (PgdA/CDA1 family)